MAHNYELSYSADAPIHWEFTPDRIARLPREYDETVERFYAAREAFVAGVADDVATSWQTGGAIRKVTAETRPLVTGCDGITSEVLAYKTYLEVEPLQGKRYVPDYAEAYYQSRHNAYAAFLGKAITTRSFKGMLTEVTSDTDPRMAKRLLNDITVPAHTGRIRASPTTLQKAKRFIAARNQELEAIHETIERDLDKQYATEFAKLCRGEPSDLSHRTKTMARLFDATNKEHLFRERFIKPLHQASAKDPFEIQVVRQAEKKLLSARSSARNS